MKTFLALLYTLVLFSHTALSGHSRGSSEPYISGDTFRAHANFVFDEKLRTFKPLKVRDGDLVFVKGDFLRKFFQKIHPLIKAKYKLITHNSDESAPGPFANYLDDPHILAWYGQNVDGYSHPKLHPIPIGIANREWAHGNIHTIADMQSLVPSIEKSHLLYMNFTIATKKDERSYVHNLFKDQPYCTISGNKPYKDYLKDLAESKFVLSPRGNGLDCHRTWECLLMDAIPIVLTSPLDPLFANLPVLIIQDWNEITEEFLIQKWKEMQTNEYIMQKAYADYWLNMMH